MNSETHVEELIAWYVMDVLPQTERRAVAAHLTTCAPCRALTADAHEAAALLARTPAPIAPSTRVKRDLFARVDADLAARAPRVSVPAPPPSWREAFAGWWRAWSPALALAGLAVVVALGWWNVTLQNDLARARSELSAILQPSTQVVTLPPAPSAPANASAKLYYQSGSAVALLTTFGLNPLGPEQTYEFWLIRGGQPVPAGVFTVDANGFGALRVQSAEAVGAFDQAGITIERAGGAATPNFNALVFAGAIK
ncbi:MAG: anti-sigma factor, partial [Chloroflexota bacterium]